LNISPKELVKTLVYLVDGKPVAVLMRGDHEVQEVKLQNLLGAMDVEMADDKQVFDITGVPTGYLGPVGLKIKLVADTEVMKMSNFAIGANEKNFHWLNVNVGRDFEVSEFADLRMVTSEDRCPSCGGGLELTRGIEVGHIFKLGTAYSRALNATFLDNQGQEQPFVMGCYGIGVSRSVAAAIEQNHDRDGMILPMPIAPFKVVLLNLSTKDEEITQAAEGLYQECLAGGIEVLMDDRDERPGVKFKDADLIGIPIRLTVGRSFSKDGVIEIRSRRTGETFTMSLPETLEKLKKMIDSEMVADPSLN